MAEITRDRLRELEEAERKLQALEKGGVDNWEWYDESLKEYYDYIEREDKLGCVAVNICEAICEHIEQPAGRGAGYGISIEGQNLIEEIIREAYL